MQIISGRFKRQKLQSPDNGPITHPMGSRERLGLFNQLGQYFDFASDNLQVLDAYAGTGALGLELLSLSSGSKVTFIEKDPQALKSLKANIQNLDLADSTQIIPGKVQDFRSELTFDLIFIDPPYHLIQITEFIQLIEFLRPGGILVLSHPHPLVLPELKLLSTRSYAGSSISLFVKP